MKAEKTQKLSNAEKIALLKQADKIMPFAQNVAAAPSAAPPPGWKVLASSDPTQGNSGLFAKIYERTMPALPGTPKYIVAFQGTKLSNLSDIGSDMEIAFLKIPRQYGQALAFVQNTCRENGIDPAEIEFTGHSLGGYLARTVGTTLGAKHIWTFNAPGPSRKIARRLEKSIPGMSSPPGKGLVQIRIANDIASVWGYKEGITISLAMQGRPHNLGNLAAAIKDTINGKPLKPAALPPKDSLTSVFDALAGKIARARLAAKIVKDIVGGPIKKSPPPRA